MIQKLLDRYTMYKIVLVALIVLVSSGFFILPKFDYFLSVATFIIFSYLFHHLFSRLLKVVPNHESWLISALILICLFDPPRHFLDLSIIILASFLTQAGKYLLVYQRSHLFNPVAISVFILSLFGVGSATWWIGSATLFPLVLVLGYLIVLKTRHQNLFWTFIIGSGLFIFIRQLPLVSYFASGPIIFFACFMLIEPLTTPPTRYSQIIYALICGFLYSFYFSFGPLYGGPEFSLVVVNLLSFICFRRQRLSLKLVSLRKITTNIYDFCFESDFKLRFQPGQYLEWTIPHPHPDSRGNRRWFSISSSPTEKYIRLGIALPITNPSTLKQSLVSLKIGDTITAHQAQGDFILPKNPESKLAFIAGGIGVTPFRSMIKYLVDTKDSRDIIFIYASSDDVFAYRDVFDKVKTIYHNTKTNGRLTADIIKSHIPDLCDRHFYLSGPGAMVDSYKSLLKTLGVKDIHTDYFPGF